MMSNERPGQWRGYRLWGASRLTNRALERGDWHC